MEKEAIADPAIASSSISDLDLQSSLGPNHFDALAQRPKNPRLHRLVSGVLSLLNKGIIYFLSLIGPVLLIDRLRSLPIPGLLALALASYVVAGFTFLAILVVIRKLIVGRVQCVERTTLDSKEGKHWFLAASLANILVHSPFRPLTSGLSPFATWYYRGMGAVIPGSVFLGARSSLPDPWFLEFGEYATLGADVLILGHVGIGNEILLGRVVIGEGTTIGLRSTIFPDVRIGRNARIGAGSIVTRGTRIGDGETWAGVPARRIK